MFSVAPLAVLFVLLAALSRALSIEHAPRDDNLPARVPYIFPAPGTDALADDLRARRPNNTLLDLDGVLLQEENFALGWNAIAEAVRGNNTVPDQMRELMILRTGTMNKAAYVWIQHEPEGRKTGLTTANLREIRLTPPFESKGRRSTLTPELRAAMLLADAMTLDVKVSQKVFDGLHQFLSDKQMVDAVGTIGTYNLVSRFVVALDVDSKMDVEVPIPTDED